MLYLFGHDMFAPLGWRSIHISLVMTHELWHIHSRRSIHTSLVMTNLHPLGGYSFALLWWWPVYIFRHNMSVGDNTFRPVFTRYITPLCSWYIHTSFRHENFAPLQAWYIHTLSMKCSHLFGHDMFAPLDDDMFTPLGNDLSAPLRSQHVHIPYVTTRLLHFGDDLFAPFRQWPVPTLSVTTCSYPFGDNKETYERVFLSEIKKGVWKDASFSDLWTINLFFSFL